MADPSHLFTLSTPMAIAVVVTTAAMYLLLVALLRTWGARLFASPTPRSWASVLVLGAIVGRASLGLDPTLEAGLLSLGTVLALMLLLGILGRRAASARPVALVVDGRLQADALERHRLTEAHLWVRLRESGRASLADVALAVLEPTGRISVIPRGDPIDPRAVVDVTGAQPG